MHYIFVYGTLKKGLGNHYIIKDQKYLGHAETVDSVFQMYHLGGYPGVVSGHKKIVGELYEVDDEAFARCDWLEGHPNFYERKRVAVKDNEDNIHNVWMYIFKGDIGHLEAVDGW